MVIVISVEIQYEYTAIFYYLCWKEWKEEISDIKIGRDNTSNKIYFSKTIKKYFVFIESSHRFYQKISRSLLPELNAKKKHTHTHKIEYSVPVAHTYTSNIR